MQKGAEIRSLIPAGLWWSSPPGCSWEFCKTLQSRSLRFNLFIYFNVPCLKCLPVALRDDGLCNLGLIFGPSRVSLGLTSFRTNILGLLFLDHLQDCFGLCSRIPLEETEFHLMRVSGWSWRPFPAFLTPGLWTKGHSDLFPRVAFSPSFRLGPLHFWDFWGIFSPLLLRPVHLRVFGMFPPCFPVPAKAKSFNSICVMSCSQVLGQLPCPRAASAFYLLPMTEPHCSRQNFHRS